MPINFIDIPTLDKIIAKYKAKYQIIYNRPLSSQIVLANRAILDLNEYPWLKENHPDVILMNDLFSMHKNTTVNNFNHLQLMVYANSSHFISIHGGTAILASCFGGINTILSDPKWGMEIQFNEYATMMPALSGAKIFHAKNQNDILPLLERYY